MRPRVLLPALLGMLLVLLPGCAAPAERVAAEGGLPDVLRVGLVPNVAPDEQRARYGPFGEHLAQALGVEVELFVAPSYAGVVTALAADQVDVAYLGGLTYVQAERQAALTPLVTEVDVETGTPQYLSAVVVPADSPARSVRDVVAAGGVLALGDPSSTSGSLYPRLLLQEAGAGCSARTLERCEAFEAVRFTGGHDATALAVLGGRAAAGGLELRVLHRLERTGAVPQGALRPVGTAEVMGYPWVGRTALGERALEQVRRAFLDLEDPALLDLLRARDYVPVAPEDYDEVRREAERLGLLR